jgi:hypothetical protein
MGFGVVTDMFENNVCRFSNGVHLGTTIDGINTMDLFTHSLGYQLKTTNVSLSSGNVLTHCEYMDSQVPKVDWFGTPVRFLICVEASRIDVIVKRDVHFIKVPGYPGTEVFGNGS